MLRMVSGGAAKQKGTDTEELRLHLSSWALMLAWLSDTNYPGQLRRCLTGEPQREMVSQSHSYSWYHLLGSNHWHSGGLPCEQAQGMPGCN